MSIIFPIDIDRAGKKPTVVVVGANSQIGCFLLPRLLNAQITVHATTRSLSETGSSLNDKVSWHRIDYATKIAEPPIDNADVLVHLAPLPALPPLFDRVLQWGVKRIIALSSTSRFTKTASSSPLEQDFVAQISAAENWFEQACDMAEIAWTLFRPTLIYGYGIDKNISTIAALIQRFGFFPLAGPAKGLRQPVHADDLAAACVLALDNPATYQKAYNLSGGETLTYRDMVARIFYALDKKPRFVRLPLPVIRGLIAIISLLPRYRYISGEMAQRMNKDLYFDHSEASRDFGYAPRQFKPNITA